jgi:hypothetical protein
VIAKATDAYAASVAAFDGTPARDPDARRRNRGAHRDGRDHDAAARALRDQAERLDTLVARFVVGQDENERPEPLQCPTTGPRSR